MEQQLSLTSHQLATKEVKQNDATSDQYIRKNQNTLQYNRIKQHSTAIGSTYKTSGS